jgi:hypothetical protein
MATVLVALSVNIFVQVLFLFGHALVTKRLRDIAYIVQRGVLVGTPSGIAFDLLVGSHLGYYTYTTGFTWWMLLLMGILSYGVLFATILLLRDASIFTVLLWSIAVAILCETTNYFFKLWTWSYDFTHIGHYASVLALYILGTIGAIIVLQLVYKEPFRIFSRWS